MMEVNRSVLVVKPRSPYVDWALSLPNPTPVTLEDLRRDANGYLVPEIFDPDEESAMLQRYYASIFEQELSGWVTEEDLWPTPRDFSTFTEWFDAEFHSLAFDLCDYEIERVDADDG